MRMMGGGRLAGYRPRDERRAEQKHAQRDQRASALGVSKTILIECRDQNWIAGAGPAQDDVRGAVLVEALDAADDRDRLTRRERLLLVPERRRRFLRDPARAGRRDLLRKQIERGKLAEVL